MAKIGSPEHAKAFLVDYLPEITSALKDNEKLILPLTLCLVQYGAKCACEAYADSREQLICLDEITDAVEKVLAARKAKTA